MLNKEEKAKAAELIETLDNKSFVRETKEKAMINNPEVSLKADLYTFLINRINFIDSQNAFRDKIQAKLSQKIDDDTINTSDLMDLYKIVFSQSTVATESLFGLFKPTGTQNSNPLSKLLDIAGNEQKQNYLVNPMDSKDRQIIEKLQRVVQTAKMADNNFTNRERDTTNEDY